MSPLLDPYGNRMDVSNAQKTFLGLNLSAPTVARNVFKQPFASNSIWNMPIGSGANYVAANVGATFRARNSGVAQDDNVIIFAPSSPSVPLNTYPTSYAWPANGVPPRCSAAQSPSGRPNVNIPANIQIGNSSTNNIPAGTGITPNGSCVILAADRRTLYQNQPLQVCVPGGPASTAYFLQNGDLYGDGIAGAHGGSGMSALGGTLRYNDILPGSSPIVNGVADVMRHALQFEFNVDYFDAVGGHLVRHWPALNNDNGNEALLVALLPTFNFNGLTTPPARSIAWTLINYGAYLVDCTGWEVLGICTELSVVDASINMGAGWAAPNVFARMVDQFQAVWGYSFYQSPGQTSSWMSDLKTIVDNLQVITNNSATSIGGGGTPRQALLPDLVAGQ